MRLLATFYVQKPSSSPTPFPSGEAELQPVGWEQVLLEVTHITIFTERAKS